MDNELERKESRERQMRGFSDSWYSAMQRRLNLQSIGGWIREGGEAVADFYSFDERERRAHEKLEKEIAVLCGEETTAKILECVNVYCNTTDAIYFSLGMKAGATLQVNLLHNLETDF